MARTTSSTRIPCAPRRALRLRPGPALLCALLAATHDAGRGDALSHDAGSGAATPRAVPAGGGDRG